MRKLFILALILAGCGPEFAVVPRGGAPSANAQAPMGITLTAFSNQWHDDPFDLADYVTPIAIELYNPGPYSVRVQFADFALKDETGRRYPAINAFVPATVGMLEPLEKPVLYASRGGGVGIAHGSIGFHGGGGGRGVVVGAPGGRRGAGSFSGGGGAWGYGGARGWGGFYVSGGLRGWYGPGLSYWDGPWIVPPYYSEWVIGWGPSFYPGLRPSYDTVRLALPEGVLPPGARVDGFLYFKKATSREHRSLDLSWSLVEARNSTDLGSLHVPLEVIER